MKKAKKKGRAVATLESVFPSPIAECPLLPMDVAPPAPPPPPPPGMAQRIIEAADRLRDVQVLNVRCHDHLRRAADLLEQMNRYYDEQAARLVTGRGDHYPPVGLSWEEWLLSEHLTVRVDATWKGAILNGATDGEILTYLSNLWPNTPRDLVQTDSRGVFTGVRVPAFGSTPTGAEFAIGTDSPKQGEAGTGRLQPGIVLYWLKDDHLYAAIRRLLNIPQPKGKVDRSQRAVEAKGAKVVKHKQSRGQYAQSARSTLASLKVSIRLDELMTKFGDFLAAEQDAGRSPSDAGRAIAREIADQDVMRGVPPLKLHQETAEDAAAFDEGRSA